MADEPKNKLTPLPGAKLPGQNTPSNLEKEIEQMMKTEANTMAVLAHGIRATAESNEEVVVILQDIRDILVKVCIQMAMPLPARLAQAIEKKEYNPDELDDDGPEDEDEDEDDGDGDVLAKT